MIVHIEDTSHFTMIIIKVNKSVTQPELIIT